MRGCILSGPGDLSIFKLSSFFLIVSVCKVLETIVRESIVNHMQVHKLYSNKQFGFISGRSTVLQLLKVLDRWTEILDEGGCIDVAYH
jgi:hypothetical protein